MQARMLEKLATAGQIKMNSAREDETLKKIKQLEEIQEELLESIRKRESEAEVFVKSHMHCETV